MLTLPCTSYTPPSGSVPVAALPLSLMGLATLLSAIAYIVLCLTLARSDVIGVPFEMLAAHACKMYPAMRRS